MDILQTLAQSSKARAERDKRVIAPTEMKRLAEAADYPDFAFERALKTSGVSFICEIKRASPSKGVIARDFPYLEIAEDYVSAGAAAISVLTEPEYFLGSDEILREIFTAASLPLLRKDFTVDEYQLYQARAIGASAALLICSLLDEARLREYIRLAEALGLSALVETHDESEVERALNAGARIIGVNNRDLRTFGVDARNCLRLREYVPSNVLFVAESGISSRADIETLERGGVDAVLIGEALMSAPDRRKKLMELRGVGL